MNTRTKIFEDGLGGRAVAARWIITANICLISGAHLGGEGGGPADMALLRDVSGQPLLPGSSLAGALRNHLCDVLGGFRSVEHSDVSIVFGEHRSAKARHADEAGQSPVIVFDSYGSLSGSTEIRDGVAIDPCSGTAEDHKKFDFELIPSGTMFPIRVELVVEAADRERRQLELLIAALDGLGSSDIRIGARRSRGLGEIAADAWRARRFDLLRRDDCVRWLCSSHESPFGDNGLPSHSSVRDACRAADPSKVRAIEGSDFVDERSALKISLELVVDSSVLVRSPGIHADDPDATHLQSGGQAVLPGSSIAGVLRSRCLKIARHVSKDDAASKSLIDDIFGLRDEAPDAELVASRLRVSERPIKDGMRMRPSRIRIDRLTQGVMTGALFEEEPQYGGTSSLEIEIRNPKPADTGLLILAIKDLLSGDLPLGGAASCGRGILSGTARFTLKDEQVRTLKAATPRGEDDALWADEQIKIFRALIEGGAG